jgi:ABC-type branched-subunit amino acid transport system substrate-binding protein
MLVTRNALLRLLLLLLAAIMFVAISCDDEEDSGGGETPDATSEDGDGDDLSSIPEDTTGVTDTEILLGTHMPLSQSTAAIYGQQIVPGMQAYFDFINDTEGGVNGRQIRLLVEDDHYLPPDTNTAVRKLVEQDGVFAIVGGLGTAQHSAVFEYLANAQVPDLYMATGATLFTDPITRTAFGYNPNYIQEGDAIGKYIAENYPDAKVGVIRQNDDFGADGLEGIQQGIEGSNVEIVSEQTYEAANPPDLTQQVQRVQNDGADLVAVYSLPQQAASVMRTAREQLNWDAPLIFSGVVADPVTIQLAQGVTNSDGAITTAYLRPLNQADDPGIVQHQEIMAEYQPDATVSNLSIFGQSVAEMVVETLKAAGQDLNRRSVIEAAESIRDFTCTLCLGSISLSPTDHRPIETFSFAQAEGDSWVTFGDLVTYESTTDGEDSGDEAEPTEGEGSGDATDSADAEQ